MKRCTPLAVALVLALFALAAAPAAVSAQA